MTKQEEQDLYSEIINDKKQIILYVDQTSDYVYPNELYKYQIYCKNVSGDIIEDIHIQVINPSVIAIDEDNEQPFQGIDIGDLKNGQSHLLYLPARCSEPGEYTVHILCYGKETGVFFKSLTINCSYDSFNNKTIHRIHIYNFSPYEDTYELMSDDFSEDVTQLVKKQKLPYKAKQSPFRMLFENSQINSYIDESQSYLYQAQKLYSDRYNTDEHTYQYLERENFNEDSIETFEGENLADIFRQINKYSKFFKAKFLRTGTNQLLNDFREYSPDGFIYRFGLMSSELYHHIGIIPEYTYMNDYLFRWASEGQVPQNLYPKRLDMNWDANRWAGHGYNVWKTYTDEYKEQIINNEDYEPLYEFIETFELLSTAQEFINNKYKFETDNEFYISTEEGLDLIKKYQYIIKESYFDNGVFFVNIPLNKIPTNFFLLNTEEIQAIIEKTKPYGMKPLIRYIINTNFDINLRLKTYPKVSPYTYFDIDAAKSIHYSVIPYKYNKIIEEYCYIENNEQKTGERTAIKLIPDGTGYCHTPFFNINMLTDFKDPDITEKENISLDTEIKNKRHSCEVENNLSTFYNIKDLLYQGNFEEISFYIKNITLYNTISINDTADILINKINYQLWIECLYDINKEINKNPHSHWWSVNRNEDKYEIQFPRKRRQTNNGTQEEDIVTEYKKIDFFEIPLTNQELRTHGIESGIGFKDITDKLHGISAEKESDSDNFLIRYTTSKNKNFKIKKQGLTDIKGLAFKFIPIKNNTLIVFFLKKEKNNQVRYYYFHHTIVSDITDLFCFVRNYDKDVESINKWSNLIKYGRENDNSDIVFNTLQYDSLRSYDPTIISENNNWQNINRIDRNEYSYTQNKNITEKETSVDDIILHFDNIDIPDDAIIKDIKLRTILESNSYKNIYPYIRMQDGIITKNSLPNDYIYYPQTIECYPSYNNNTEYYEEQLTIAEQNNMENSIKLFKGKIIQNKIFDESLEYSLNFLENSDDFITIKKPYWIEISDFTDDNIPMNDISEIKLYIEGYNPGKEVYLTTQLAQKDLLSERKDKVLIPSGYFRKKISLKFYNKFTLSDIKSRFMFKDLNDDLLLFDTYLEISVSRKQDIEKDFEEFDTIEVKNKKIINMILNKSDINGYLLKNGLTVKLEFDDLEIGEYYRIYSVELNIIYRKQNIDFLVSPNLYTGQEHENHLIAVGGINRDDLMSGMFFDETIMPGAYQSKATLSSENQGIELQDALFQSFIATTNNMTGITIYPNGFIGNPDINLKIALYENKGNTPNRLVKEIRVGGWTKANDRLRNASVISYDFNVNNLKIGDKYWIKIEVDSPIENNYYLLKYLDSQEGDMKLLARINNNLINTFGCLKFHINTLDEYKSFDSLPASEQRDFINPKAFIGLNKSVGELEKLIFLRSIEEVSDEVEVPEEDISQEPEEELEDVEIEDPEVEILEVESPESGNIIIEDAEEGDETEEP